jgi:hypothetical protein
MGYNIEISCNILKNTCLTHLKNDIKNIALNHNCEYLYEDYEFDKISQFNRNHILITTNFSDSDIDNIILFINKIKKYDCFYLESIYNDNLNTLLYASNYYITQKMNKKCAKQFKEERKKRSYSLDETMILNALKK